MVDVPLPSPGDTDWNDWAAEIEAAADVVAAATDAATVSTLVMRDAAGRFKAVDGVAASDVATKGQLYVPPSLGTNFSNREFSTAGTSSRAFTVANNMQWVSVKVPVPATFTGFRYRKGTGTAAANVIGALYDAAGTRVAVSGTIAQGTVASVSIDVPFGSTYAAVAGLYWVGLIGSSTNADFSGFNNGTEYLGPSTGATQGSFVTPSSFTPPGATSLTSQTTIPLVVLY